MEEILKKWAEDRYDETRNLRIKLFTKLTVLLTALTP